MIPPCHLVREAEASACRIEGEPTGCAAAIARAFFAPLLTALGAASPGEPAEPRATTQRRRGQGEESAPPEAQTPESSGARATVPLRGRFVSRR